MDVREKLVELIRKMPNDQKLGHYDLYDAMDGAEDIASYLIDHGVTVQEWISVTEMLPKPFVPVLVQMPGEEPFPTVREGFISNDGIWQSAMFRREPGEVTHWQPMPQPPKGE